MRLAVMGDIHSNHTALRACLASALSLGSEAFLLLGDYVSDCACPEKTLALLRALSSRFPCRFVAGNREEYMLNHLDGADDGWRSPSSASGSLLFTFRRLARRDFDFFRSLPIAGRFDVPGFPALEYCHGSPLNTRGNLAFGSQDAKDILASLSSDLLVCAHTHIQGEYTHAGKRLVNPVSVGIPWRYDGKAQFAVLRSDGGPWDVTFFQIDYPRKEAVRALHESGLYSEACVWARLTEHALLTGDDLTGACLRCALEICMRTEGRAEWSRLPERCWQEAAERLGV